jgi:aminomethyltransferase
MTDSTPLQYSPLNDVHLRAGAKMVPFAGFSMPVQYAGIAEEHLAVRSSVGVFDISHMGQFFVSGPNAQTWLNGLLTNNIARLSPGQGQYTLLLNERGGVIDDLIAYQLSTNEYFLVVNASMILEDFVWMSARLTDGVTLENRSAQFAGMAVQGPQAAAVYQKLCGAELLLPPRNGIATLSTPEGDIVVCRTGYTGEDGFEFFCPAASAGTWWDRLVALGAKPCGLGARDTLRLEMGYPLNGNDLSPNRTPLEAGLGFFVDLTKSFIGQEILVAQKSNGLPSKLCGVKLIDKGPPLRSHYPVISGDAVVGELCSGGVAPSLQGSIGMAYLPPNLATVGTQLSAEVRGKRYSIEVVKKPFYKKPTVAL